MKRVLILALTIFALAKVAECNEELRFRNVYTSKMVLQQNRPLRFVGKGHADSNISLNFHGTKSTTKCDENGNWTIELPAEKAGGPYEVTITDNLGGSVTLNDIYVGELWLCSGQSNMDFPLWCEGEHYRLPDGQEIAAKANDPKIRLLNIPCECDPSGPHEDLSTNCLWETATSAKTVEPFSAVGWWFGQYLRKKLGPDVAIGLVDVNWGGTRIGSWMPIECFDEKEYPELFAEVRAGSAKEYDAEAAIANSYKYDTAPFRTWIERFNVYATEITEKARKEWSLPDIDLTEWHRGERGEMEGQSAPGVCWFRFTFDVPEGTDGNFIFHADYVNDCDETYLDGEFIGATLPFEKEKYWSLPRDYAFTAKPGRHCIGVRAIDHRGEGLMGDLICVKNSDGTILADFSKGEWIERIEYRIDENIIGKRPRVPGDAGRDPRTNPHIIASIWNTMMAPLTALNIRGTIWYQGESDVDNPSYYADWHRKMIDAWRKEFRDPDMPFALVLLAPMYRYAPDAPHTPDFWRKLTPESTMVHVEIREQQMQLLDYPQTGIANIIDSGNDFDIHPKNKEVVGERLAYEAFRMAYGFEGYEPAPAFDSLERKGNTVQIRFKRIGKGLYAKGGTIGEHLFTLQDATGKWHWATGKLQPDSSVIVSSPEVPTPTAVAWCWTGYPPDANLYRLGDNQPIFPFNEQIP